MNAPTLVDGGVADLDQNGIIDGRNIAPFVDALPNPVALDTVEAMWDNP